MNGVHFPGASGATLSVPFPAENCVPIAPRGHCIFFSLSPVIFATPIRSRVFISWKIMKSFSTLMGILNTL